jgi:hypothetical protein
VFRVIHTIHPEMKHLPQYRFTGESRCPRQKWIPAFEAVMKFTIGWICAVRPSRQLLRSFLRMRDFLNALKGFPHAEEHPKGASRSTHGCDAANFLTASFAGKARRGIRSII